LPDKAKCTSSQQVQFNFFGHCSTFLPFAYEVEIEKGKSIRRRPNLAALQAVIHAVVVGIIMLITKGLVDAASVSSDPLSCLRNRREEAPMRWLYLAVIIVFAAATLLFILQNGDLVTVSFLGLSFRAPFAILIAIAYVLGAATGGSLFALLRRSYRGSQRLSS